MKSTRYTQVPLTRHPSPAWTATLAATTALAAALTGCRPPAVTFPARPIASTEARRDYDTDGDGKADFFLLADGAGRFDRIAYDRDGDGRPDHVVHLDAVDPRLARHLVIVLDGIPYDVLRGFYDEGHLRVFHPPAVVISPYPVLTDLALEDAFGYMPCEGPEARYFRRSARAKAGGAWDYITGRNEPFARIIGYRLNPLYDAAAYLWPGPVFRKELNDAKRLWDRRRRQEEIFYFVSAAALGTRKGKAGQLHCLRQCERLINQVLFETGGLVKITLFADHGQTNIPARPAKLKKFLRARGWHLTDRLKTDRDVAMVHFGLVTYAAFGTRKPARLADDLLKSPAVELVSYVQDDAVIVRTPDGGEAAIRSKDGKTFQYETRRGDPLNLAHLAKGKVDGRDVLRATVKARHEYPDALYRLWRAHFALAENAPDVIASLDDHYHNGSETFAGAVTVASTHGGLNWRNSATFFMTTAAAVTGPLRSEDIPAVMRRVFGRPFPSMR